VVKIALKEHFQVLPDLNWHLNAKNAWAAIIVHLQGKPQLLMFAKQDIIVTTHYSQEILDS